MDQDILELASFVAALFDNFRYCLAHLILRNITDSVLFCLLEEEEDEELIFSIINSMHTTNRLILSGIQLGNQYPPPKQDTLLFPDFIASNFRGRDVFVDLQPRPWLFYDMTGETVESFQAIVRDLTPILEAVNMQGEDRQRYRPTILSMNNRILLVMIWLWRYKSLSELSPLFLVSPAVVERNIKLTIPI